MPRVRASISLPYVLKLRVGVYPTGTNATGSFTAARVPPKTMPAVPSTSRAVSSSS
jgi:hypothetical protein